MPRCKAVRLLRDVRLAHSHVDSSSKPTQGMRHTARTPAYIQPKHAVDDAQNHASAHVLCTYRTDRKSCASPGRRGPRTPRSASGTSSRRTAAVVGSVTRQSKTHKAVRQTALLRVFHESEDNGPRWLQPSGARKHEDLNIQHIDVARSGEHGAKAHINAADAFPYSHGGLKFLLAGPTASPNFGRAHSPQRQREAHRQGVCTIPCRGATAWPSCGRPS